MKDQVSLMQKGFLKSVSGAILNQYTRISPTVNTEAHVNVGTNNRRATLRGREQDTELAD